MAVSEALGVSRSTFGAGLAADDLVLTAYFAALYALAARVAATAAAGPKPAGQAAEGAPAGSVAAAAATQQAAVEVGAASTGHGHGGGGERVVNVYSGGLALALAAAVCHVGTQLAAALGAPSQGVTIITAITVALATAAPRPLGALAPSAEGLATLLMQVFVCGLLLVFSPSTMCV